MRAAGIVFAALFLAAPSAHAVRFTIGVGTSFTPIGIAGGDDQPNAIRLGLIPVLEVEPSKYLSFGAHAPLTLLRLGQNNDTSSGAESVFGLQGSLRYPIERTESPEEILLYGTFRFGYATLDARAGLFLGGALGVAATTMTRGIGFFGELGVGHLTIAGDDSAETPRPDVTRLFIGLSVGILFRLGGESWRVDHTQS